jgi:hypothetical protein
MQFSPRHMVSEQTAVICAHCEYKIMILNVSYYFKVSDFSTQSGCTLDGTMILLRLTAGKFVIKIIFWTLQTWI